MRYKQSYDVKFQCYDKAVVCYVKPLKLNWLESNMIDITFRVNHKGWPHGTPYDIFYKGVATLKEGDTSNLKEAKAIARRKAIRAATSAIEQYNFETYQILKRALNEYESYIVSIGKTKQTMTDEIKAIASGFQEN